MRNFYAVLDEQGKVIEKTFSKNIADVLYAIDMHLSGDIVLDDMAIIELVYSVTNSRTVQKFYKDEAEELDKLAEGYHQLSGKLKGM